MEKSIIRIKKYNFPFLSLIALIYTNERWKNGKPRIVEKSFNRNHAIALQVEEA